MHLDIDRIQRLLHGELTPGDDGTARAHAAACAECSTLLSAAEREEQEVTRLLGAIDHPVPHLSVEQLLARGRSGRIASLARAAAVVLLVSTAGVALAMPGSPLRAWIANLVQRDSTDPRPSPEAPSGTAAQGIPQRESTAGIAITPGLSLLIEFTSLQPAGEAIVTVGDDVTEVVVVAPAGLARFTAADDRLLIDTDSVPGLFEIRIPRAAPHIRIRWAGTLVFEKNGMRLRRGATEVSGDRHRIPLRREPNTTP